jgi:hypothetical protein
VQIIALEVPVPGADPAGFAPLARDEAAVLWRLVQEGIVRGTWFRADRTDAVLLLERGSEAAAREALARLPFVAASLIAFELIPLRPYPGFARLFADDGGAGEERTGR